LVFSPLHFVPSAISALLVLMLAARASPKHHKHLAVAAALFGLLGLAGYISGGNLRFYPLDLHVLHSWIGVVALFLCLCLALDGILAHRIQGKGHRRLGYAAAVFALAALLLGLFLLSGQVFSGQEAEIENQNQTYSIQEQAPSRLPEVESSEYMGFKLLPVRLQGTNAILGTQVIDRSTWRLIVTGLVNQSLSMSYDELLKLPAYSEAAYMPCVEGWGFEAKWTGFRVTDLLNRSGMKAGGIYVVFQSVDGYSTGLPLDYLRDNEILLAYGINDLTLPPERGFPLQLVAKSRYGYKWAKWITKIEVVNEEVRGYWESRGYSNSAKVGEFPFG
jgi:DMSO/TMAO reductase YedYZ molybdopterin-dependent catalytic subunit